MTAEEIVYNFEKSQQTTIGFESEPEKEDLGFNFRNPMIPVGIKC